MTKNIKVCSNCSYSKIRYECDECSNVYLCRDCYDYNISIGNHPPSHSMTYLDDYSDSDESEEKNDEDELEDYDDNNNNNYDDDDDEENQWEKNRHSGNHDDDEDEDYYDDDEEDDFSENYADFFEELDSTVNRMFQKLNTSNNFNKIDSSNTGNGSKSDAETCQVYTCPYCPLEKLTEPQLFEHVLTTHSKDKTPVVCPICSSRPGGDSSYFSKHFPSHLTIRHSASSISNSAAIGSRLAKLSVEDLNHLKNSELLPTLFSNTSLSSVLNNLNSNNVGGANGGISKTIPKKYYSTATSSSSTTTNNKFLHFDDGGSGSPSNINFLDSNNCINNKINLKTSQNNINLPQSSSLIPNSIDTTSNINSNSSIIEEGNIKNDTTNDDDYKIKRPTLSNLNQSSKLHSVEEIERKNNEIILKSTFARELLYDTIFS